MDVAITEQIEQRSIDELIPHTRNSRKHTDAQIEQIANSMREWGWTNPVIIDEENNILAGHGRVMAGKKIGATIAPVIVARGWSDEKKRAYIIADNKIALNSSWDNELLSLELNNLNGLNFDFELTGFNLTEFNDFNVLETEYPVITEGEKEAYQVVSFNVHDSQAETIKEALKLAKLAETFDMAINKNSNGNAIARICETYILQNGKS